MTSHSNRLSSRYYEKEAEVTRHRLADSLHELSDRLTPGQVLDEVLSYAKGGGGTFLRALTNASRENPVPSLLIGAGCLLFLSEKMGLSRYMSRHHDGNGRSRRSAEGDTAASNDAVGRGGAVSRASGALASGAGATAESLRTGVTKAAEFAHEQTDNISGGLKSRATAVGDTISSAAQQVRETAHDLRDLGSRATARLNESAESIANTVQERSASIGDQISESTGRAREQVSNVARQVTDKTSSFINEQPLLCAAIGLAVGAAIAAALPSTKTEDKLMGETSDTVKEAVGKVASEQFETVKAAAGKVAQKTQSVAAEEGLTAAGAAEAARSVVAKVKRVVTETSSAAKSELKNGQSSGKDS